MKGKLGGKVRQMHRRFGGKSYNIDVLRIYPTKTEANRRVRQLRQDGYLARTTKVKDGYLVFLRRK